MKNFFKKFVGIEMNLKNKVLLFGQEALTDQERKYLFETGICKYRIIL